jgi:hypothetical protein
MVTKALVVASQTKDITDAQSYRSQDIALNGNPVSVTADYLHYWINAQLL